MWRLSVFEGTTIEEPPRVFLPLVMSAAIHSDYDDLENRRDHWLYLFARLKPGSLAETRRSPPSTGSSVGFCRTPSCRDERVRSDDRQRAEFSLARFFLPMAPGEQPNRGEMVPVFVLLFSMTGIVILIACANIANLLLARGLRAREVRRATVARSEPGTAHRAAHDRVAAFSRSRAARSDCSLRAGCSTSSGRRCRAEAGTLSRSSRPAAARVRFHAFARDSIAVRDAACDSQHAHSRCHDGEITGRRDVDRRVHPLRSALVTSQIALALALLVVAGLFARSLVNISRVDLGMQISNLTTFRVSPAVNGYSDERIARSSSRSRTS